MALPNSKRKGVPARPDDDREGVFGVLNLLVQKVDDVEAAVAKLHELVESGASAATKVWYTTGELAATLGVSQYTVQVRWCAEGRIECEKDPDTKKWRIPATEYDRLVRGGSPRARPKGG